MGRDRTESRRSGLKNGEIADEDDRARSGDEEKESANEVFHVPFNVQGGIDRGQSGVKTLTPPSGFR